MVKSILNHLSFNKSIITYAHDEPNPYDKTETANDLGLSEDHRIVQVISSYTYEILLEFQIEDEDTCKLVSVNGNELKEPESILYYR